MIDMLAETWTPPHLAEPDQIIGLALVMNRAGAPALRLSDQSGHPRAFRAWCRQWLTARREALAARAPNELMEPASFFVLTALPSASDESSFDLGEFSYGSYPAAPDDWEEAPLERLIAFAIDALE